MAEVTGFSALLVSANSFFANVVNTIHMWMLIGVFVLLVFIAFWYIKMGKTRKRY